MLVSNQVLAIQPKSKCSKETKKNKTFFVIRDDKNKVIGTGNSAKMAWINALLKLEMSTSNA